VGALDRVLVQVLPYVPRYIAGETLEDALRAVGALNGSGVRATVDVLGEFVHDLGEAELAGQEYVRLVDAFAERGLDSQASVKLTQLGLKLDFDACLGTMRRLVEHAQALDTLMTIDMEDSSCTDATLDIFETLRRRSSHVGAVLQARLRRSMHDLRRLLPLEPNVRICKGIYLEPPEIAFDDRDDVRRNFLELVDLSLSGNGFVGIATHDEVAVRGSYALLERHDAQPSQYEFQMLLGVRDDLRRRIQLDGHPLRVYVPFGRQWYAYSMRRLKENPAIAGHVLRNLMRV